MLRRSSSGRPTGSSPSSPRGTGKVRAVAKGVRKPGSRFGARLEPTSHVAFQCYRGRASSTSSPRSRPSTPTARCASTTAASPTRSRCSRPPTRSPRSASPTPRSTGCSSARCARSPSTPSPLVSAAFFWKLLSLEGFHPMLDACARCGDEDGPVHRRSTSTRAACSARRAAASPGGGSPPETLELVRRILGGDLRGALAEPPGRRPRPNRALAVSSLEHHLERRLRSAALLSLLRSRRVAETRASRYSMLDARERPRTLTQTADCRPSARSRSSSRCVSRER